ncbi:MAG TPA: DUF3545 domain-containing protein, partial [Plesiomonas shigelloides]|nr:DUF3545 domain-containing protein [Plesiomonas shigelloides]
MEGYFFDETDTSEKTSRGGKQQKKRKWREIEALKDKYRLQRELKSIDILNDYS